MRVELGFVLFSLMVLASRLIREEKRKWIFVSIFNLTLVLAVFFLGNLSFGLGLIVVVGLHYILLERKYLRFIPVYLLPLLLLGAIKTLPTLTLIGVSFLSFRMLSAASEVHAGRVGNFSFWQYLIYCFFMPTFKLGPIGTLEDHLESVSIQNNLKLTDINWIQAARIAYGTVKLLVFTPAVTYYAQSLSYGDWKQVYSLEMLIGTGLFSYMKIYLSFSGFNDISIGLSHFLGFKMKENFLHPFKARNVSEFWSNWHVSLTDLLKELIFIPLNIKLLKAFGRDKKYFVIPIIHFALFIAIGLWHGVGWSFVVMGTLYALAASGAWFFSLAVTKVWSGYKESRIIQFSSIVLTQIFIGLSFIFFECNLTEIRQILHQMSEYYAFIW